jgi:hypothetical protein
LLEIRQIVARAEEIVGRVEREFPDHPGLLSTAQRTVEATREAARVSRRLRRKFGVHHLPATFLVVALCALAGWCYL